MRTIERVALGAIVAACVFSMGRCSAGDRGFPPHDAKRTPASGGVSTVRETETVTRTVDKYLVPDSCIKALEDLEKITSASSNLADVGVPQLDIMSRAHEAIAGKDYKLLVDLQEQQLKINDRTIENVKDLEVDFLPRMRENARQCKSHNKD